MNKMIESSSLPPTPLLFSDNNDHTHSTNDNMLANRSNVSRPEDWLGCDSQSKSERKVTFCLASAAADAQDNSHHKNLSSHSSTHSSTPSFASDSYQDDSSLLLNIQPRFDQPPENTHPVCFSSPSPSAKETMKLDPIMALSSPTGVADFPFYMEKEAEEEPEGKTTPRGRSTMKQKNLKLKGRKSRRSRSPKTKKTVNRIKVPKVLGMERPDEWLGGSIHSCTSSVSSELSATSHSSHSGCSKQASSSFRYPRALPELDTTCHIKQNETTVESKDPVPQVEIPQRPQISKSKSCSYLDSTIPTKTSSSDRYLEILSSIREELDDTESTTSLSSGDLGDMFAEETVETKPKKTKKKSSSKSSKKKSKSSSKSSKSKKKSKRDSLKKRSSSCSKLASSCSKLASSSSKRSSSSSKLSSSCSKLSSSSSKLVSFRDSFVVPSKLLQDKDTYDQLLGSADRLHSKLDHGRVVAQKQFTDFADQVTDTFDETNRLIHKNYQEWKAQYWLERRQKDHADRLQRAKERIEWEQEEARRKAAQGLSIPERRELALLWYHRYGGLSRASFKQQVKSTKTTGLEPKDVDLLSWSEGGTFVNSDSHLPTPEDLLA